ncbi:MAG TPA: hypothetical protein VJO14_07280 [Bacteroidota bacterium]|nr:hypothetical protein [Bacteroidota bacterium]
MKRISWIILIAPLLLFFQGRRLDVAGKWDLDLKKSGSLPPSFSKVESYTLNIAQNHDTVTVNTHMKGAGQDVDFPPFVYVLNGKETYRKDSLRGSERWSACRWSKDKNRILMDTRILLHPPGRPPAELLQHDVWRLLDPKTLEISTEQRAAGSDSTHTEWRIYRKVK